MGYNTQLRHSERVESDNIGASVFGNVRDFRFSERDRVARFGVSGSFLYKLLFGACHGSLSCLAEGHRMDTFRGHSHLIALFFFLFHSETTTCHPMEQRDSKMQAFR